MNQSQLAVTGWRANLFYGALTAAFVSYFLVWLPGPGVGLSLIGLELGEWIKFLGVGQQRVLFYLPPIVLGFILALLAATWPNTRPSTWLARGMAVAVSLLAFPAIAAIQLEPASEWVLRLVLIVLVTFMALLGSLVARAERRVSWLWLCIAALALAGAVLPSAQYLAIRPVVETVVRRPISIGVGVWLSGVGFLAVSALAYLHFRAIRATKKTTVE